jgi:hypothetical protein
MMMVLTILLLILAISVAGILAALWVLCMGHVLGWILKKLGWDV